MKYLISVMLLSSLMGCSHQLPDFTSKLSTRGPVDAPSEAIGEYALGCLKGAQTFTGREKGLVLSQVKRGRYWGHPDLIQILTQVGFEFSKENKKIIVADLSQSRGGPTLTGHNSHQNGLDVDVWFKVLSSNEEPTFSFLETEEMKPMDELGPDQIKMINLFAQDPLVERIFINPAFKKKLCELSGDKKITYEVQRKLRPWWGHDDHIHVRLKCPGDSPACISQKTIPPGDGCGEELNWWFSEEAKSEERDFNWEELKSVYLKKVKALPDSCSFYKETF